MPRATARVGPRPNTYAELGPVYDEIWPLPYKAWGPARKRMLRSVLPHVKSVCELGCGSGIAALDFARRGLKVFALDLSVAMCRVTREKVRKSGLKVDVRRADMRSFRLPEPVDLVCSQWGVINHLPKRTDLPQVARAVARALRPGGYFYFDLHQKRFYEELWTPTDYGESSNLFAVQHGGFDRRRGKGWTHLTWFVRRPRGIWERHDDDLEEIEWPHAEIVRVLRKAELKVIRVFDFPDLSLPPSPRRTPDGLRTMYLARKTSR
ncbi:MAG: class I SAM-dependent methyltransferase [Candidatus Acidiferrales bacterium]